MYFPSGVVYAGVECARLASFLGMPDVPDALFIPGGHCLTSVVRRTVVHDDDFVVVVGLGLERC